MGEVGEEGEVSEEGEGGWVVGHIVREEAQEEPEEVGLGMKEEDKTANSLVVDS